MRCVIDIETASTVDLTTAGADAYAEDPTTRVLCLAYQIDSSPIVIWLPGQPPPANAIDHIHAWVSHNAAFEIAIWLHILAPQHGWPLCPPAHRWSCTMARAMYHGLPAALDDVAVALRFPPTLRKDAAGRRVMMQLMKPRSVAPLRWWEQDNPAKFDALQRYCVRDVEVEAKLDKMLPELPPTERELWLINHAMNLRGVLLDADLIERMSDLVFDETRRLNQELRRITNGRLNSVNQVATIRKFLDENYQVKLDVLDRDTVSHVLATDPFLPVPAARILEIRAEAAKTSTAKLVAMRRSVSADGYARGLWRYYGASRTGRYSSQRIQLQNMARPTIKDTAGAIDLIEHDADGAGLELFFEDTPLGVISSCLRGCIIPAPGNLLAIADLAQIEARVIAWLAGQRDILDVFASGQDVYTYTASRHGSTNRQLGKVEVLALGFGMGKNKFVETAAKYGIILTLAEAQLLVEDWRDANPKITQFWYDLNLAAHRIAARISRREQVGRIGLERSRQALVMILPSGRELFYQFVGREWDPDHDRMRLTYEGMNQYTRRWEKISTWGGKLAENATQAVARDVLTDSLRTLYKANLDVIGTVHDELIVESPAARADWDLKTMLMVMQTTPAWAPGLPVGAEGRVVARYGK